MNSPTQQILIFAKSKNLCAMYREIFTARGFDLIFANCLSHLNDLIEKITHLSHVIFDEEMNHFPMEFLDKLKEVHDFKLVVIGISLAEKYLEGHEVYIVPKPFSLNELLTHFA